MERNKKFIKLEKEYLREESKNRETNRGIMQEGEKQMKKIQRRNKSNGKKRFKKVKIDPIRK